MLDGSLVTTAWLILRLQMEQTPSSYGGQLRIYWISSRGQPTGGGPPDWGVGLGTNDSSLWKACYEHSKEASLDKRPKQKNMDMRFGTCHVRSMYRAGSLREVGKDISKYKLALVGVQEVRWVRRWHWTSRRIYIFLWKWNENQIGEDGMDWIDMTG
jgi:hypothetical protein